jgi:hypothetical protein
MSDSNGVNPQRRATSHPYRDSALAYAALGTLVVLISYFTGSGLLKSLAGGVAAFVLATAWTWWRMRARERESEDEA